MRTFQFACHRLWARTLLWILKVSVEAEGVSVDGEIDAPQLLVSNHLSYLDVLILGLFYRAVFVAKSEVAGWPLLGWLARLGGTIFLRRGHTASNVQCVYRVSRQLRQGSNVHVFPEGTTTDGRSLANFNPLFFVSAIRSQSSILPLTLQVRQVNRNLTYDEACELFCWYGDTPFLPHFWRLLRIDSAKVALIQHEPIAVGRRDRARLLARRAQDRIGERLLPEDIRENGRPAEQAELSVDFVVGALLFSLLASHHSELVRETIPADKK